MSHIETELPELELTEEDRTATMIWEKGVVENAVDDAVPVSWLACRERQLKSSLAANREQKAEIERLKAKVDEQDQAYDLAAESAEDRYGHLLKYGLCQVIGSLEAELASLRASVGEKWIDVKQELPPANKNHCWLAWITSQNKNGGYIDLVSYGEYICFNEECHEGDANYVEHDDGNMKRAGWYREEETHGGEFDYIFVDLNDKVTHWQPLPVAPTLPGEEK